MVGMVGEKEATDIVYSFIHDGEDEGENGRYWRHKHRIFSKKRTKAPGQRSRVKCRKERRKVLKAARKNSCEIVLKLQRRGWRREGERKHFGVDIGGRELNSMLSVLLEPPDS